MDMYGIIEKKRDGRKLSKEEIRYWIEGIVAGRIPDYQTSALLMAIYLRGMDRDETYALTECMMHSGDIADLSDIPGIKVDKHSTGGVGDKTTLVVAPVAAAAGVPVAKMSGRGLGFTGGTIDKLEAIPGFRTKLTMEEFKRLVRENGIAVMGQTADIAKADKILYALRDVTATIENISLIASSIMSKKLASGSNAIVLDVKCGDGAFMHSAENAVRLAELLVAMGKSAGRRTAAVISNMDTPLGRAVGNSLEVAEAVEVLRGDGPEDIHEICLELSGLMIFLGEKAETAEEGRAKAEKLIQSGAALEKFRQFISAQGGDPEITERPGIMGEAEDAADVIARSSGVITSLPAEMVGYASQHAGAGRAVKDSEIDLNAGIVLRRKPGDAVDKGEVLATVYGKTEKAGIAADYLKNAYEIGNNAVPAKPVVLKKVF